MSEPVLYVGIDLGNTKQAVCVVDRERRLVGRRTVEVHEVDGFLRGLMKDTRPEQVVVGVEDPHHIVVSALVDGGFSVFAINPKQAQRFRERTTASGAKDDARDAQVLARALTTDIEAFHQLKAPSESEARLSVINHTGENLDEEHRRASNQLRAVLILVFPALVTLCQGADERWFWDLVALFRCDVSRARRVRTARLEALLKKNRKRAVTAAGIEKVVQGEHLEVPAWRSELAFEQAKGLIERLRVVEKQRVDIDKQRRALIAQLAKPGDDGKETDVGVLISGPGVAEKTVATLMAEAGPLVRDRNLALLRAISGVAPVTTRSGKSTRVSMRYACNWRLRNALFHAAFNAARTDPHFKAYREELARRGKTGARALRSIADKLLRVLVAMLKDGTLYGSPKSRPAPTSAADTP